jgi:hypothetical protein
LCLLRPAALHVRRPAAKPRVVSAAAELLPLLLLLLLLPRAHHSFHRLPRRRPRLRRRLLIPQETETRQAAWLRARVREGR